MAMKQFFAGFIMIPLSVGALIGMIWLIGQWSDLHDADGRMMLGVLAFVGVAFIFTAIWFLLKGLS